MGYQSDIPCLPCPFLFPQKLFSQYYIQPSKPHMSIKTKLLENLFKSFYLSSLNTRQNPI